MPVERLRWIAFSHLEADECGAVDEFLEVAPHAQVAHGALGVMLSLQDQLPRPPRPLDDGDVLDIGGASLARRVLEISTPHVPHNWESHMFFEQETKTLFLGDLLTQLGNGPAVTSEDLLDAAIVAEDVFHQTSLGPAVPATYRRLADLNPARLAIMHGSSYDGDCAALLRAMADVYEERYGCLPGASPPSRCRRTRHQSGRRRDRHKRRRDNILVAEGGPPTRRRHATRGARIRPDPRPAS